MTKELIDFYDSKTSDFFCICNTETLIIETNKNFEQFVGLKKSDLVNDIFLNHINTIDKQNVINSIKQVINTKENTDVIFNMVDAKYNTFTTIWNFSYDTDSENIIFTGKSISKFADKIFEKSRLFTIVNSLTDWFLVINRDWKIIYYNNTVFNEARSAKANLDVSKFWEIFPKSVNSSLFKNLDHAFNTGKLINFIEFSPTLNKWLYVNVIPYNNELNIICKDVTSQILDKKTKELKIEILKNKVSGHDSFNDSMKLLLEGIETIYPSMYTSLVKIENERIYHIASPRLSDKYLNSINGVEIGENKGSCGTAAFRKEMVIVNDIETDILWADFKDLIRKDGFKSCWSVPIIHSKNNSVLAAFGIYYTEKKTPTESEVGLINRIANIIRIILEEIMYEANMMVINARYAMVSMATNDVIYEWDNNAEHVFWNDNLYEMFGYLSTSVSKDKDFWENHIHQDDREKTIESLKEACTKKRTMWISQYRFLSKNGTFKYIAHKSYLIYGKDGEVINIIGAMQDIDELKKKEISMKLQNDKLMEIAQISSHELRGPVTSILGLINIFNKTDLSDKGNADIIEYLEYSAKQLDDVIHDIVAKTIEADHTIYIRNKST